MAIRWGWKQNGKWTVGLVEQELQRRRIARVRRATNRCSRDGAAQRTRRRRIALIGLVVMLLCAAALALAALASGAA